MQLYELVTVIRVFEIQLLMLEVNEDMLGGLVQNIVVLIDSLDEIDEDDKHVVVIINFVNDDVVVLCNELVENDESKLQVDDDDELIQIITVHHLIDEIDFKQIYHENYAIMLDEADEYLIDIVLDDYDDYDDEVVDEHLVVVVQNEIEVMQHTIDDEVEVDVLDDNDFNEQ